MNGGRVGGVGGGEDGGGSEGGGGEGGDDGGRGDGCGGDGGGRDGGGGGGIDGGGRGGKIDRVLRMNSPRPRFPARSTNFCRMVSAICAETSSVVEPDGTIRVIEISIDSLYSYR